MEQRFLLNGFRIWLANDFGNSPLSSGELRFYYGGTSTPANAFKFRTGDDSWGTRVSVDANGYVGGSEGGSGIWLDRTRAYDVEVWKKVSKDPLGMLEENKNNGLYWQKLWDMKGIIDPSGIDAANTPKTNSKEYAVNTIADLRTLNPIEYLNRVIKVNGYYDIGDTETPMYFISKVSKNNDDGGSVIAPNDSASNGRFFQIFGSVVDVSKFGALPNGIDCLGNIKNALKYCLSSSNQKRSLQFSLPGIYTLSGNLNFGAYNYSNPTTGKKDSLHLTIKDGVCFDSKDNIELDFGNTNTTVESDSSIVSANVDLKFSSGSVEFIRPQWFYNSSNLFSDLLVKAGSLSRNPTKIPIKVFGDLSNYTLTFASGIHSIYAPVEVENISADKNGLEQFGLAQNGAVLSFESEFKAPTDLFVFNTGVDSGSVEFNANSRVSSKWFGNFAKAAMDSVKVGVLDVYGWDLNGFSIDGNGCNIFVHSPINLLNASLQNVFICNNDSDIIFENITQTSGEPNLKINNYFAYLEWFTDGVNSYDITAAALCSKTLKCNKPFTGVGLYPYGGINIDGLKCGSFLIYSSDDSAPGVVLENCEIKTFKTTNTKLSLVCNKSSFNGSFELNTLRADFLDCQFIGGYDIELRVSSSIYLNGNTFYGLVKIKAPRTATGIITNNYFLKQLVSTQNRSLVFEPLETETSLSPSRIIVKNNSFKTGYVIESELQDFITQLTYQNHSNDVLYFVLEEPLMLFDSSASYRVIGKSIYDSVKATTYVELNFITDDSRNSIVIHLGGVSDNAVNGVITRIGDNIELSGSSISSFTSIPIVCSFIDSRKQSRWN